MFIFYLIAAVAAWAVLLMLFDWLVQALTPAWRRRPPWSSEGMPPGYRVGGSFLDWRVLGPDGSVRAGSYYSRSWARARAWAEFTGGSM